MTYSIVGMLAALVLIIINRDVFGRFLLNAGRVFFAFQVAAVTANLFTPVVLFETLGKLIGEDRERK